MLMSDRERQLWTKCMRECEQCKDGKCARKRRARKGEVSQLELEAALDDLTAEAGERRGARPDSATE